MKYIKLKDIITIRKGKKHILTDEPEKNSKRVLMIDDLRNDDYIKYSNDSRGVEATVDDILIAWDGANAGTIGFGKGGYAGSTIGVLKIIDKNIKSEFLGRFLQTQFYHLQRMTTGSTIPHIDRRTLEKIKVPVQSISNQMKIALILKIVESLIALRKESALMLDKIIESKFLEMFGDPIHDNSRFEQNELQNLTIKIGSGSTPRGGKNVYKPTGTSFIRSLNVHDNYFKYDNLAYINKEQAYKLRNVTVKSNDVLFNITGASVCRCTIVPENILPARVNQHVSILRLNPKKIIPEYLCHLLLSKNFKKKLLNIAIQGGATREAITKDQLKSLLIPVPSIDLQIKFSTIIKRIKKIKAYHQKSLDELQNLYGSLSQKAFKGELDLSNLHIEHIAPQSLGGNQDFSNLQVLTAVDNIRKADKMPEEWDRIKELKRTKEQEERKKKEKGDKPVRVYPKKNIPIKKIDKIDLRHYKSDPVNASQVANWIKEEFLGFHFTSEMLINFLNQNKNCHPAYFTSKELKENRKADLSQDFKEIIFQALSDSNEFLRLEQLFYNSEKENFILKIHPQYYDFLENNTLEEHSGIYLKVKT
jgi:type I restriction enzyme, S subunit